MSQPSNKSADNQTGQHADDKFDQNEEIWCTYPSKDNQHLSILIGEILEIGSTKGVPYIKFTDAHNPSRILQIFGAWTTVRDSHAPKRIPNKNQN